MAKKSKNQRDSIGEHYLLGVALGDGGNADVFEAQPVGGGDKVALKVLRNRGDEKEQRFRDEIAVMRENAGTIEGILPIIDYDCDNCWYTMPIADPAFGYLMGTSENIVTRLPIIINAFLSFADTLILLHEKGISHRDIKPDNLYYYNGRFCLGDFGLVDFPDKDNNLTRDDRGLGAVFTIAPEMKRNPSTADGRKADVYSLAKTLWMFLTLDQKGFDGKYDWTEKTHRLHSIPDYDIVYLADIEELLADATEPSPEKRITMSQLRGYLVNWLDSQQSPGKQMEREWAFLNKYLFHLSTPRSVKWDKRDDIIHVLNTVAKCPAMNHMLVAPSGGLDLNEVIPASESDAVILCQNMGFLTYVKPDLLCYETFPDTKWNYFLLIAKPLPVLVGKEYDDYSERVIEDSPGSYVSAVDAVYGVYDYDSGKPLPKNYRVLERCLQGAYLVVLKQGPYNFIPSTYDGRHFMMGPEEFRSYVWRLQDKYNQSIQMTEDESAVLEEDIDTYEAFPVIDTDSIHSETKPNPDEFVRKNYPSWRFKEVLEYDEGEDLIRYYFLFDGLQSPIESFTSEYFYALTKCGKIRKRKKGKMALFNLFYTSDRMKAIEIARVLNNLLAEKCVGYELEYGSDYQFTIRGKKRRDPNYIFSKEEMETVMRNADDRKGNRLVIDEHGHVQIVDPHIQRSLFPVSYESFDSRNNYVGKYSTLSALEDCYNDCLKGWNSYLRTGECFCCDD